MRRTANPALWLALCGAAASFFAFANPIARLPLLVLGVPLSLALLARQASSARAAFKWGWISGFLAASASLYWIVFPVHDYGGLPWALALPCPLLVGMVLGLYPGLFCLALHMAQKSMRPLQLGLFAGLAWVAVEALRGWLFSGFPWLPLAVAFVPWPVAIQGAAVIGAFGLSGVVTACGIWLAESGFAPRAALIVTLALFLGYGVWALQRPVPVDGTFNALMVQGNIDQGSKWEPDTLDQVVGKYISLTSQAMGEAPGPWVVIWPETAMTFYIQEHSAQRARVEDFIHGLGVPLVTGAPGYERIGADARIFNRAYLFAPGVSPGGGPVGGPAVAAGGGVGIQGFYDKEHLVPFGEYAPFGRDIPFLASLMQGVGAFTPGSRTAPLVSGRLAMGMLICYEAIFPALANARVEAGANVLVNISNDAWFGRSSAPRQHLELAALRAVEQERYLLRCTNTGITALIDPKGRITHETPLFEATAVNVSGVGLLTGKTAYHRIQGWFEGVCALAALALLGLSALRKKHTPGI